MFEPIDTMMQHIYPTPLHFDGNGDGGSATALATVAMATMAFDHQPIAGSAGPDIEVELQAVAARICALHRAAVVEVGLIGKNDKLSYLPQAGLVALSSKAAAPILDQIIARIDAGERPSATAIKDEIAALKTEPAEAKPVPRQRQHGAPQGEQEPYKQECRGAQPERKVAAAAAANMLAACLGVQLSEFLSLAAKTSPAEIFDLLCNFGKLVPVCPEPNAPAPIGEADDEPPLPFPVAIGPTAKAAATTEHVLRPRQ